MGQLVGVGERAGLGVLALPESTNYCKAAVIREW